MESSVTKDSSYVYIIVSNVMPTNDQQYRLWGVAEGKSRGLCLGQLCANTGKEALH